MFLVPLVSLPYHVILDDKFCRKILFLLLEWTAWTSTAEALLVRSSALVIKYY